MPQQPSVLSAGTFIVIAVLAFVYHMVNRGVDGSGLMFFLMTVPWGLILPDSVTMSAHWDMLAYPAAWLMIIANTVIIGVGFHYVLGRNQDRKYGGPDSQH